MAFVNERELASQGQMSLRFAADMEKYKSFDFYKTGTGDKASGKFVRRTPTQIVIMDETATDVAHELRHEIHTFDLVDGSQVMSRHMLSDEDVDDIFRKQDVISLASCTRKPSFPNGKPPLKRKVLEYHLDLMDLSASHYLVTWAHDNDTVRVMYKGSDRAVAVAEYNELDA